MPDELDHLIRLLQALGIGLLIGLERERREEAIRVQKFLRQQIQDKMAKRATDRERRADSKSETFTSKN